MRLRRIGGRPRLRTPGALTAAVLVVATGLVCGAGPASTALAGTVTMGYACQFPSGPQQVSVQTSANFPAGAPVNQLVQPTAVSVTVTVPHGPLTEELARLGAATVSAHAELGIVVTDGGASAGASADASWPGLATPSAPVPAAGALRFAASGAAPPVTPHVPGNLTFSVVALDLMLAPRTANGSATAPGTISLSCTSSALEGGVIATVPVTGAAPSAGVMARQDAVTIGSVPGAGGAPTAIQPQHVILPIPPQPRTSYTNGYADVRKLNGSALLGEPAPSTPDVDITLYQTYETSSGSDCQPYVTAPECTTIVYSTANLNYQGQQELPPVTDSFLAFGFTPVTATIQISIEPSNCPAPTATDAKHTISAGLCLLTIQHGQYPAGQETTATSTILVHLSDVKVNGVPLKVSSNCTAQSSSLILVGSSAGNVTVPPPGQYIINSGGTLSGTITIPSFNNCMTAAGENLDALFDATVAGTGNYLQITQGSLCYQAQNSNCPPPVPAPSRAAPEAILLTFQGGAGINGNISCSSDEQNTTITGQPGTTGTIGTVNTFQLSGCTAQPGGTACTASGKGLPWPIDAVSYDPVAEQATGTIGTADHPVDVTFTCGSSACTVEVSSGPTTIFGPGSVNVVYDYRTHTLTDFGAAVTPVSSNCQGFAPGSGNLNELFIPSYTVNGT